MFNLYLGLDIFRKNVHGNSNKEKIERWLMYYQEYKETFDILFQKLYMMDVQQVEPIINTLDFEKLLIEAENGLIKHPISTIEGMLDRCVHYFKLETNFDVFLLVGFGHIDGAAPPSERPFLYIGLERLADSDIHILIPHEFNHLVRFHHLRNIEPMESFTVKQLIIAEGLATLTPLMMNRYELNDDTFIKALMISNDEYKNLKNNLL
jgi:Predicted Zn-dependent protease (DUF2268)